MNADGITTAFDLIIEEISSISKIVKDQGASAFREGRYKEAQSLAATGERLSLFRNKVEELCEEWHNGFGLETRGKAKKKVVRPRAHRSRLKIWINGKTFEENVAADSFILALSEIGLDRIEKLGLKVRGIPLIGTQKSDKYIQRPVNGRFIMTHSSTQEKKDVLEKISKHFGIEIKVEIVECT